jgi:hypothetical protein
MTQRRKQSHWEVICHGSQMVGGSRKDQALASTLCGPVQLPTALAQKPSHHLGPRPSIPRTSQAERGRRLHAYLSP